MFFFFFMILFIIDYRALNLFDQRIIIFKLILLILTCWLYFSNLISSTRFIFCGSYISVLNLSALSLILAFNSSSILSFYFFFELTLIPVLILILGWGYQPERLTASFYIFFYTLFGSLPLLIIIMTFIKEGGGSFFSHPTQFKRGVELAFLASAFLIKTPIYFSHIWLPKAHVEAPVAGSIILAGLMLKLGSLGLVYLNYFF